MTLNAMEEECVPQQLRAYEVGFCLDHLSVLDVYSLPAYTRLTGIICTIGPVSRDVTVLVKMMRLGMNIARLNFSHGTYRYHAETIANIRKASTIVAEEFGLITLPVAIALDTKGPEIRTGLLEGGPTAEVTLLKGKTIKLTTNDDFIAKGSDKVIYVGYKNITKVIVPGNRIYIDDGLISLMVKKIEGDDSLVCEIENGGNLGSKKGVNLPGVKVDLPMVTAQDKEDILFGVEQGVDIICASFMRNAEGVDEIRKILGEKGRNIRIVPKIENHYGLKNADEIIAAGDGIMIDRGDLGSEIPLEKVILAQKMIIAKCNVAGKPVICATHMLESMITNPRPTRAEISDVTNAVLDGTDCVMLSGETAKGDYPVQAVEQMHFTCLEAEAAMFSKSHFLNLMAKIPWPTDATTTIAMSTVNAALSSSASAIIVVTLSDQLSYLISKYRPRCPIIAVSSGKQTTRQARLYHGILPLHFPGEIVDMERDVDERLNAAIKFSKNLGLIKQGDSVIIVTSWRNGTDGTDATNTMRLAQIQ